MNEKTHFIGKLSRSIFKLSLRNVFFSHLSEGKSSRDKKKGINYKILVDIRFHLPEVFLLKALL